MKQQEQNITGDQTEKPRGGGAATDVDPVAAAGAETKPLSFNLEKVSARLKATRAIPQIVASN